MAQVAFEKNKQKAKQVLILYSKLLKLQESCWGQLFLFQKTECFESFNRRFRMKDILQIRLDDLIYLLIQAGLMVLFNLLASDPSNLLFLAYRQFCIYLFISSAICLIVRSNVKYILLLIYCIFVPALMKGIYSNWISLDPTQSLDTYSYMGQLSLFVVIGFTLVVYPLKSFIQSQIGSLYSYLYGLSVICLFGLWPIYSIVEQMIITSGSITLSIIYNNKALVISFIVIIVFSFYLIVHKTFFQGNKQKHLETLKSLFTSQEINKAIQEIQTTQLEEYSWHNVTSRIMSLFVLASTLGLQIFIFFQMQNDSSNMIKSISLMVFGILFLIIGTFYVVVPISNKIAIPIFTVLSLVIAPITFFYSQYFLYWEYLCSIFSLPYIVLFWTVVRGIQQFRPLLQNKILTMMYIFIHIPIMIFAMDVLDYFNSGNSISPVGYVSIAVVILAILFAALYTIVKFCLRICKSTTQQQKNNTQLDFTYSQPLNYKPYKKSNTFTLSWVAEMNLIDMGIFINSLFYLVSNTIAFYSLNQLTYNYVSSYFFSQTIYQLTYSQFLILFIFMLYCHYFMSTNNDTWDFWMLAAWAVTGLIFVILSYVLSVIPNTLRIFGGFCLVMFVIAIGFQYVKDSNKKIIPFVAPVLIFSLWLTIVLPYVIIIPTASIYVSQSDFGTFIYNCILGSALLLIVLVGIVSMIFNILMNKFEEEKRYKYVIQDVKAFLDEEGVDSNDEVLHVFHEAYQCRDRKYIFYLKNGYPINVTKNSQTQMFQLVTYDTLEQRRTTQVLPKIKQKQTDCCWSCLTFFCGQDQDEINEKVKKAIQNNLINEQEAETLFPDDKMQRLNRILKANKGEKKEQYNNNKVKPEDIHSTKSLLLNSMAQGPRRLSPQYTLLKLQKQRRLGLQIYGSIFELVSNNDKGQNMVIYNDFKRFCEMIKAQMDDKDYEQIFNRYARSSWGDTVALNEEQFATAIQNLAFRLYNQSGKEIQEKDRIIILLIQKTYYNLAKYQEFNQMRRNFDKIKFNPKLSPFNESLQRFKISQKQQEKQVSQLVNFYKKQKNYLDQPRKQGQLPSKRKKKQSDKEILELHNDDEEKGKSCKKTIYENFVKVRDSCSNVSPVQQTKIIKRQKIKPWSYLAVESAKILHRKYSLWEDQHETKEYEFRLILNNIFMAVFKLADLYTYLEITLRDPQVGWYDKADFSFLYIDYKYQLYLCLVLAFITVPMGIKGISFISQDRLGLTEARVPAGFPHPMFFYTVIYKILVLSLFVTISSTFLVTFSCTWTLTTPYKMYLDSSIQCLSQQHNIYIILSLIFLIIYFPLSSYTFPNFQFSEKRLDLKYRPSYLVLYFQINFVLVANKVLLSVDTSQESQIAYISINIVSLLFLSLVCLKMKPCLIEWFNWIEFLTIFLGFLWNVGGLVLFLTGLWTLCVIIFSAITVISIIAVALIIKRFYFSTASVNVENDEDQMKQLQLGRNYQKAKNKMIIAQIQNQDKFDMNTQNINKVRNSQNYGIKNVDKQLIPVEDVLSMTEQGPEEQSQKFSTLQIGKK